MTMINNHFYPPGTTTAQRCFTCNKATNTYECTHGGEVVSCPSGQVNKYLKL